MKTQSNRTDKKYEFNEISNGKNQIFYVLQIYENFKFVVFEFDCCRAFLHAAVMSLQPPR